MSLNRLSKWSLLLVVLMLMLLGCQATADSPETEEDSVAEAATAIPTDTPAPTNTPVPPTETPAPTDTPEPTATAVPTDTPEPTPLPTDTPEPSPTPAPKKPTETPTPDKSSEATSDEVTEVTEIGAGVDAMALILDSEERTSKLDSVTIEQNISATMAGLSLSMLQTCVNDVVNASSYCRSEVTTAIEGLDEPFEAIEEILLIEDRLWTNTDGAGWVEATEEEMEALGITSETLNEQFFLSEYITEAEVVGETTINGQPSQEIEFVIEPFNYMGDLMGQEVADSFASEAGEVTIGGTLWIGNEDLLPSKATINMSFFIEGEPFDFVSQVAYYDYNAPVDLPDPRTE